MSQEIKWAVNTLPKTEDANLPIMSISEVQKARAFHQSFPQYTETPLAQLTGMADYLGVKSVFIKDESYRFGLNAFKVLGGSYSIARYIAKETGKDVSALHYEALTSQALRDEFGQATFFTATDGNHGRGVAWAAQKLGQKAVGPHAEGLHPDPLKTYSRPRRRRRHPRPQL
jgi:diaminopropionate ammonia-lyase